MFDFERPNIEVSEISEDKKYGKFVVKPWKEAMVLLWVTPEKNHAVFPARCRSEPDQN